MRLVLFLLYIAVGLLGGWVARSKGRNPLFWALLAALFPLLIVVVLFLPARPVAGRTRRCPNCSEVVRQEAAACGRCGRALPIEMTQCRNCGKYVPLRPYCSECSHAL